MTPWYPNTHMSAAEHAVTVKQFPASSLAHVLYVLKAVSHVVEHMIEMHTGKL